MASSFLTPTIITRKALQILHQKCILVRQMNRQYDNQFANSGASPSGKIGPSLTIRLPNRFTVSTGPTLQSQDVSEDSVVLTVSTQKHVDFTFGVQDLTLTIDEFADRYLNPAMAQLASGVESDVMNVYKDVYNFVDNDGAAISFLNYLQAGQKLNEFLAPDDGRRQILMNENHNTKLVDALKGLFNPQGKIGGNFESGEVGRDTAGFSSWKHSSLFPIHTTGTAAKTTGYTVNGANQTGSSITIQTGSTTFLKGDLVTFAGCNAVHAESKVSLGYLQQFTVTADSGANATTLAISPAIVTSGAKQNVSASPTDTGAVVKLGAGASETLIQSLCFHPDFATFVTADLIDVSKFGAWGAREVYDGLSLRLARQYDIYNDRIPCRIDILYGYKTIRPQLAVRVHADG